VPWFVHVWWTDWLLGDVAVIVNRVRYDDTYGLDYQQLASRDHWFAIEAAVTIVTGAFAIAVVRGLSGRVARLSTMVTNSTSS
jgi:hypothetical protein